MLAMRRRAAQDLAGYPAGVGEESFLPEGCQALTRSCAFAISSTGGGYAPGESTGYDAVGSGR